MRSMKRAFIFLVIAMSVPLSTPLSRGFPLEPQSQTREQVTEEDLDRWISELSNWGRWGKEDQLAAINLITSAKRWQAAALVKGGARFPWRGIRKQKRPSTLPGLTNRP